MSVGVGCPSLGDLSHGGVVRIVVVPDDHGKAAASLAVGEPVGADAGRLERRHDLIEHVRNASLEVGRELFSKAITCAFMRSSSRVRWKVSCRRRERQALSAFVRGVVRGRSG